MPTIKNAPLPSFCPDCYLFDGVDQRINPVRVGAITSCPRGHKWEEMDDFDKRMALATRKRKASETGVLDLTPEQRQALEKHRREAEERGPNNPTQEELDKPVKPFAAPKGKEIIVYQSDYDRLSNLLGQFQDSASLFGAVFALQQDLTQAQETVANMQLEILKKAGAPADPQNPNQVKNGDQAVVVYIPERHVNAMEQIAEANGVDVETYVRGIVETGCDSGWFF